MILRWGLPFTVHVDEIKAWAPSLCIIVDIKAVALFSRRLDAFNTWAPPYAL